MLVPDEVTFEKVEANTKTNTPLDEKKINEEDKEETDIDQEDDTKQAISNTEKE